jgi:Zn-dependent protease with chaperone function
VTSLAPPRPSARGRAAVAVLLLLGFYAIGLLICAVLVALDVWLLSQDRVPARLIFATGVVVFALLRGMFFVERRSAADDVNGIEVTEAEEPRLWATIREVAASLATDPPAHVYLVPDVNAFVFQRSRFMGLVPGERVMGIGVPLLEVLSPDELRGVLAHEFGHYTGGDTRLGPLVYRGRASIGRTIHHLGDNVIATVFRAYGKLYLRVSQAVSRRQELDADANAAHLVGSATHASALRKVHVSAAVFDEFVDLYAVPLWENGARPKTLYEGFRRFHDDPEHAEALTKAVAEMAKEAGDRYDSHPPLGARLAALGDTSTDVEPAPQRAVDLLADAARTDDRMSQLVSRLAAESSSLVPVEWDDQAAERMCAPNASSESERLRGAVSRLTGRDARVADALDLLEQGKVPDLAYAIEPRLAQVPDADRARVGTAVVARALAGTVAAALTTLHGWRWELRWSGPAALVSPKGKAWDYGTDVFDAVADPAKVPALRKKLKAYGIPV